MTNLIRREPTLGALSLRNAMDRLLEDSFVRPFAWPILGGDMLAIDMYETDEAVIVKATVPGIKADDIDINVAGDVLTIRGEHKEEQEVEEQTYYYRERRQGSFSRSIQLPKSVTTDKAEAEFEDGVLKLTLPKIEEAKPKSIKIKTKK